MTILCNKLACKLKNNPRNSNEEICPINEICNNCTEIVLTCYKGHCIGGPLDEDIKDSNNNQNHNKF